MRHDRRSDAVGADPCLSYATDLLCHLQPAHLTYAELAPILRGVAAVRARIGPASG